MDDIYVLLNDCSVPIISYKSETRAKEIASKTGWKLYKVQLVHGI